MMRVSDFGPCRRPGLCGALLAALVMTLLVWPALAQTDPDTDTSTQGATTDQDTVTATDTASVADMDTEGTVATDKETVPSTDAEPADSETETDNYTLPVAASGSGPAACRVQPGVGGRGMWTLALLALLVCGLGLRRRVGREKER